MRGHTEHRGHTWQLGFDPLIKQFTERPHPHPFAPHRDPPETRLLADLGIDVEAVSSGRIQHQPTLEETLS